MTTTLKAQFEAGDRLSLPFLQQSTELGRGRSQFNLSPEHFGAPRFTHFAPVVSQQQMENRQRVLTPHPLQPIDALRPELESVVLECGAKGWDGYNAEAVSTEAYLAAERFISSLPIEAPLPDVSADPDGCVTFEWYGSPRHTLLVSVRPVSGLDYAALIGDAKAHGFEPFSDKLPDSVKTLIQRVVKA